MSSSKKSHRKVVESSTGPALVREAGVPYRPGPAADPIANWMDLMEAVEALCPHWPVRTAPPVFDMMRL